MKKSKLLVSLLTAGMVFGMSACESDPFEGQNPDIVEIYKMYAANEEAKGNTPATYEEWLELIKGPKGDKGDKGDDGVTPVITIGENGNWFINGVDSGKKAQGEKGADGSKGADAVAPKIEIGVNNNWFINDVDTNVSAIGTNGKDAIAPTVTINDDGEWCINGQSTGVKATGDKGDKGEQGDKGDTGLSAYEIWMKYHPHYAGDEEQWSDDLGNGVLAGFLRGHGYDAKNITIEETEDDVIMKGDCKVCHAEQYVLKTMKKVKNATFHVDEEARSAGNKFIYDADLDAYVSTNQGVGSSNCYLDIVFDTAGLVTLEYTSDGEGGFDYLYFGNGSASEASAYVNCKGSGSAQHYVNDTYSREVEAGEVMTFVYKKDNSGDQGEDGAVIKFDNPVATYAALDFDTNGGNVVEPLFLKNGRPVGDLPTPVFEGKYFEGWYVDSDLSVKYTPSTVIYGNKTLYAKWSDAQYVTFNPNGGSDVAPVAFRIGTTPVMPADPTRAGFIFLGWYKEAGFVNKYEPANADASFPLFAKWMDENDACPLTGSYAGFKQSGTGGASTSYAEMTVDVLGNYKVREYYNGYFEGTLSEYDQSNPTPVITTNNNGSMIYDSARGIIVLVKDKTITASTNIFVMKKNAESSTTGVNVTPVKVNNTSAAVRLFSVPTGNGDEKINIVVDALKNQIIYDASIIEFGGNPLPVANITPSGSNPTLAFAYGKMGLGSEMTILSYNGSGYINNGDNYSGVWPNATKGNLTLSGAGKAYWPGMNTGMWDYEEIEPGKIYLKYGALYRYVVELVDYDTDYTYYERKVEATFDFNYEGSTPSVKEVLYDYYFDFDEVNDAVAAPTREGYTFAGWYDAATNGTYVKDQRTAIKTATTFYAYWLKNITVSFMETDDTAVAGVSVKSAVQGSAIGELPAPTKEGKVFMGWYADKAFNTAITAETVATAADIVAYAKWEDPVVLTINYGGASPKVINCAPGVAPVIEGIDKEGYAIVGYYAEETFVTPVDLSNGITADTTVYAKYINLNVFAQNYVGYNLYSSNIGSTKTGNDITGGSRLTVDSNLATGGRGFSGTIIGYTEGVLTTTTGKAGCVMAPDGTIFVVSPYSGIKSTVDFSSKDYIVSMSTGAAIDNTVTMKGTLSGTVYTVVCTRGTKTYTISFDSSNNTITFVSYTDSANQ